MLGLDTVDGVVAARPQIVVKKYANRRLYDTESSAYITLDDLAEMVRSGRDFVVYDARTGDDITRPVLTQVIMEEETRGRSILPTAFLRQLIGFYGDSLQGMVPQYLDEMMTQFAANRMTCARPGFAALGVGQGGASGALRDAARSDVEAIERAARTIAPVLAVRQAQDEERAGRATREEMQAEIAMLRGEIETLRELLHTERGNRLPTI